MRGLRLSGMLRNVNECAKPLPRNLRCVLPPGHNRPCSPILFKGETARIDISFRLRGRCYACDGAVVGVRDRRPEGGEVEKACARHADPSLSVREVCMYCGEATRKGSIYVDGDAAHRVCHVDACRDFPRRVPS